MQKGNKVTIHFPTGKKDGELKNDGTPNKLIPTEKNFKVKVIETGKIITVNEYWLTLN